MTVLIKVTIANRTKPYFYPGQRLRLVSDWGSLAIETPLIQPLT